jgi:hypothetical protein
MAARDKSGAKNKEPRQGGGSTLAGLDGIAAPATLDGKALLSLPAKKP